MQVGDLVTYGNWYCGKQRVGMVLERDMSPGCSSFGVGLFVMWTDYEPEWECEEDLCILTEESWAAGFHENR